MEVKENLVKETRAELLKLFQMPCYTRNAKVVLGEPSPEFKKMQADQILAQKEKARELKFKGKLAEFERKQKIKEAKKKAEEERKKREEERKAKALEAAKKKAE